MTATRRLGVVGGRGHVGAELLGLLAGHGGFEVAAVASRSMAGQVVPGYRRHERSLTFEDLSPELAAARGLDAWVLALPNGEAAAFARAISPDAVVVDLSADHRFDDRWTYGLPERRRDELRQARRIANPGCYATGAQLALWPLLGEIAEDAPPQVFGVSGYSGAGTTPSPRNDPERLRDNLLPYSLVGHLHEREVSRQLGRPICFSPHVASFFRGITLTISIALRRPTTAAALQEIVASGWRDEPLVRVIAEVPEVRDAALQHTVTIGGFAVAEGGRRAVLVATLDNLRKGAATQALQNLNLACGFAELEGIS